MKKVIRLTESDLVRIVKRVINEQETNEFFKRKKSEDEKDAEEKTKQRKNQEALEYKQKAVDAFRSWFRNHSDKIGRTKESIEKTSDEEIVRMAKGWGRYERNGEIHTLWRSFKHHFPNVKI